jgi:hypothetical protein
MATVYEDLVAKAVAKGIDPELAAAAAEKKLSDERRSLIEMSEETAPAAPAAPAPQSRQALIRKATAKGIAPELAAQAADQKLARDAQKAFERAETFEQGYAGALGVGAEPEFDKRRVFADVMPFSRPSLLPAVGEADVESVYAMPAPRPMGDPTGVVTLGRGAYVARKPPAPKSQYDLLPMEELTPEQRLDVEAVRREESIRRAQAAQQQGRAFSGTLGPAATVGARALGASPAGAATMMIAPELVGLASYGYERLATPDEPSVMEMLIRGKPGTTTAGSRPQGASNLLSMQLTDAGSPTPMLPAAQKISTSLLPTDAEQKAFLEQRAAAGGGTLEEQAAARLRTATEGPSVIGTGLSEVGGRVMNAGTTLLDMAEQVRDVYTPTKMITRSDGAAKRLAKGLSTVPARVARLAEALPAPGTLDPKDIMPAGTRMTPEEAQRFSARTSIGVTQAQRMRKENALLAEANPQKYVPTGPSNDLYQQLASSPEDALLTNPVAFNEWAKLYPAEAMVARQNVDAQRGALPSVRVPGAAKALSTDEIVSLVRAGRPASGAPQGIAEGLRLALAEGDVAKNVRDFANDPSTFYEKAAQFDLDGSRMPAADFLKDSSGKDLPDDEYLALAAFGDGRRDDAGRILLDPQKAETVRTLLGLRKSDPTKYRTYIDAIIEGQNQ